MQKQLIICLFYRFIVVNILVFFPIVVFSQYQNTNAVKSQERVLVGEQSFFLHKVAAGETLYSISRLYGVKVGDIIVSNIEQTGDIKPGMNINVPDISAQSNREYSLSNTDTYFWHIVDRRQTAYTIALKYYTTVEFIQELNPEIDIQNLKSKQAIKIPFPSKFESISKLEYDSTKFIAHKVQAMETLYSFSKQYNISIEEIHKINSKVQKEGLKTGEYILLPRIKTDTVVAKKPEIQNAHDWATIDSIDCAQQKSSVRINQINVVMFLPFFTKLFETNDEVKTNNNAQAKKHELKINPTSASFIEFYNGAQLAFKKHKENGMKINLQVFDTETDKPFQQILSNAKLSEANLIVGPAFNDQMKQLLPMIDSLVIVVSPVSDKEDILKGRKSLSMIVPTSKVEEKRFVQMMQRHKDKNIVMVHPNDIHYYNKSLSYRSYLNQMGEDSSLFFKNYAITNFDLSKLENLFQYGIENVLAIPVNDEAFVNSVILSMRNFMIAHIDSVYKFTILGMPEWLNYKTIDIETLFTYGYQYVTPFYSDRDNSKNKKFFSDFDRLFNYEPLKTAPLAGYNYALLGFEIVDYFLSFYAEYGNKCPQCLSCYKKEGISTNFNFKYFSNSEGAVNTTFHYIKFLPDYTINHEILK